MLSTEGSCQKVLPISLLHGDARLLSRARNPSTGQLSGFMNPSQGYDAILQLSILAIPTGVPSHVNF
jgi:hypothetical protein